MSDHDQSPSGPPADAPQTVSEHLNIKVTDGNNEVFFKIKRSTKLEKLMNAFCERQGKQMSTVRFLFDGQRVQPTDSPDTVSPVHASSVFLARCCCQPYQLPSIGH
jgi:Ubiquitin-2 like Rad60 SUMO-like